MPYVIVQGDPLDGIEIIGNKGGKAFESHDEALFEAERFDDSSWWIVEVQRLGA